MKDEWSELEGWVTKSTLVELTTSIKNPGGPGFIIQTRASHGAVILRLIREARIAKELEEALKFYAKGQHLMMESLDQPGNFCPPIGHYAKSALTRAQKMREGG